MKRILTYALILIFCSSVAAKGSKSKANKKPFPTQVRLKKVGSCTINPNGEPKTEGNPKINTEKTVMILKQWHLSPTTVTKGFKEKYPQEQNQTAIYRVLEEGVKRNELQLIVSEGCEGEINSEFKPEFNGWSYLSLKAQSGQRNYSKILTLTPLKIEAKFGDKITTICGDKDALIQEGNLRLSNLRGWLGFIGRLQEYQSEPEKLKPYAESAAELLKVPKDTPIDKLLLQIKGHIKQDLDVFKKSLNDRNDQFVSVISERDFKRAAVVLGGLHANDLKEKLSAAGIACEVFEPPGYRPSDEKLIEDFEKSL